jgi:hypothetical protein
MRQHMQRLIRVRCSDRIETRIGQDVRRQRAHGRLIIDDQDACSQDAAPSVPPAAALCASIQAERRHLRRKHCNTAEGMQSRLD